jgi:hypothetical protein
VREVGAVDPQVRVPPFKLAGKEFAAVAPIDWQCARALGGNARVAGQQWDRSNVWTLRMLPLLVAAIWRLLLHGLVALLCFLAVSMAGGGAWRSVGAMETTVRGCSQRQERSAELLRFGLIWDALTDRSAAWCARVEVRACDRAATGVARGAVEVEGVARSRRLGSAQPCHGTECTRVAVGPMHALWTVSERGSGVCILPVAAYKSIPGQGSHPYAPSTYIHSLSAW